MHKQHMAKAEPIWFGLRSYAAKDETQERLPVTKCMMKEITAKMISR